MKRTSIKKLLLTLVVAMFLTQPLSILACDIEQGEFCTPGYWKNNNSLKNWRKTGLNPDDSFQGVFGVNTTFSLTLMDILNTGGGEANALGRHAVAAILNASLPDSTYPYTPSEIVTTVSATLSQYQATLITGADLSADNSNIESLKDLYEALNENQ
ncbi:MAG: hypothetical protein EP297_12880 [Gammaproteobacteria bacterium]|nr:MAG: hypothetical protein EP297_12880 [Gammaproteobacteria bacterium]